MIFDIELIVEKVLDLLFFPRLTFTQEVNEFVLLVFVELRGPTAPEVRSEFTEASFVPASDPVRGGALRSPDVISGFLQRGTFVQPFEKDEAFEFLLIVRLTEEPIQILFTQVPHDFLLSSSHYTKEILLLNNFAESLSAEQAGWSGEAAIDASGFQRDQTSYHYRDRANYSFQSMKTTILIDVNSLAIKDVHFTTQKAWDGHIGMQVFRRNAEDLRVLSADANYSWSDLREECRSESTRPLIKHREQTPLQKAHNSRMNEDYNQRWMSETGFSQLKEDDGEKLRSRSWHGQFRELTRKCIVHNLTQAAS